MTWEGYNYEDAVLLSERLVMDDVYTSVHIEEYETEEVSRTSLAFSPKIARSKRSSAVSSVSPFGVTFPTKISPALTSAPILIIKK